MAQDTLALFGSAGATRYKQLLASNYRVPCYELLALNADGSTLLDLTPWLAGWASGDMTDQLASITGTFVIANPQALFERFNFGAPYAGYLVTGRILRFRKGLVDPVDGTRYLLAAQYGQIINTARTYQAPNGKGGTVATNGPAVQVSIMDALKDSIKQKHTSEAYTNTEVNLVAADLLTHFGGFTPARLQLATISHVYAFYQSLDEPLADCLKTLYDPLLMMVRADEAGNITTRPRLGTALAGFGAILGYPDQTTPPPAAAVSYVIPSSILVESLAPEEQNWDGLYNQCKVLGQAVASQQTLGAIQQLFAAANDTIAATDKLENQDQFSQSSGSGGGNTTVAKNVWVEFNYSTNHDIGDPHTHILSKMKWQGAYDPARVWAVGDACSYLGASYARQLASPGGGADPLNVPTSTTYWEPIAVSGPFDSSFYVVNETGQTCGYINLAAVTDTFLVLQIEGRQFTSGTFGTRHHGGFDYNYRILGQPALAGQQTLTAYADYNVQSVASEALTDPFGDHITYQAAHSPFAMSHPVTVYLNTGSGSGPQSAGTIAADGTQISGQTNFSVDFERGRIVLADESYSNWSEDDNASHPLRTGGTTYTTGTMFGTSLVLHTLPAAVYQSGVAGEFKYVLPGLVSGQGYDLRLTFADASSTDVKQRVFSVYVNGIKSIEGLDIYDKVGKQNVYQVDLSGIVPDPGSGAITVQFTQYDPFTGAKLSECTSEGTTTGHLIGQPIATAVQVLLPQGQGASPYAINSGGAAINPTPPAITCDYGYSPAQVLYGIQSQTIDNPEIADQASAQAIAQYNVQYSQWRRFRDTLRCATIPHLQPGDLIEYTNPLLNGTGISGPGVTFWSYIESVSRTMQPASAGGGGEASGGADTDTYKVFILYVQAN